MAILASPLGRAGALAAIALLVVAGLYLAGQRDGREAARTESIERTLEAVETRRDVEDRTAREPDPAGRLLEDWTRD